MVDFGNVSHLDRIRGAPVWLKRGDDWKVIGLVIGKTNFDVSTVVSYAEVDKRFEEKILGLGDDEPASGN